MNAAIRAVLFIYAIMVMLVLGIALSPARAQIFVAPPRVEFGDRRWYHDDGPYRYEDRDRYWRHRHWRRHHHDDDDD